MTQTGFYFDSAGCTGCKACQVACKDKNGLDVGVKWRRIVEVQGGGWSTSNGVPVNDTFAYHVSVACMHCENPICVEVCPTKAMAKGDDGIVAIDPGRCIGCRYCEWACPYGAPQFDKISGMMTKCDLCRDHIGAGKAPACVSACQMRVLDYGEIDDLNRKYGEGADVYPLPDPALTLPASVLNPHPVVRDDPHIRVANREEIY